MLTCPVFEPIWGQVLRETAQLPGEWKNTARVARWQRPLRRTDARAAGKMVSG